MSQAFRGIRPWRFASDCWSGGDMKSGARCPMCGRPLSVGWECRMQRPPALAWLRCASCDSWWDLGEIPSCHMLDVATEARRRAETAFRAPQRTLEDWCRWCAEPTSTMP